MSNTKIKKIFQILLAITISLSIPITIQNLFLRKEHVSAITSDTANTTYIIGDSLTNSANGYGNYTTHSQHLITNLLENHAENIDSKDGRKFSEGITILSNKTDRSIKNLIFQVSLNNCSGPRCKEAPVTEDDLETVYNLATDGRFNNDIHIFFLTGYRPVNSASYSDFQALSHNPTMRSFAATHENVDVIDYSATLETITTNYGRTAKDSTQCTENYSPSDTEPLSCYAQTNGHPNLKGSRLLAYLYNEALTTIEPSPSEISVDIKTPEDVEIHTENETTLVLVSDKPTLVVGVRGDEYELIETTTSIDNNGVKTNTYDMDGYEEVKVILKGDINMNGALNARDSTKIDYYLLSSDNPNHIELSPWEFLIADINSSESVTARDASLLDYAMLSSDNPNHRDLEW